MRMGIEIYMVKRVFFFRILYILMYIKALPSFFFSFPRLFPHVPKTASSGHLPADAFGEKRDRKEGFRELYFLRT